MRRTKKLTISAMGTALCVICLAGSVLLPNVTLSLAALAGLFSGMTVLACGYAWAAGVSVAAALLGLLLLPDKTAAVWFLCFFGHYPLWKALIEGLQTKLVWTWLGWGLKLLGFAGCMALLWLAFRSLFLRAIPYDFSHNAWGGGILILALVAAFVAYDRAFTILIGWFQVGVLPRLRK